MAEEHAAPASFTGRPRRRRTSPLVRWSDRIARWAIAAGGIGTIATVSIVCIFLVYVVVPLFEPASIDPHPAALAPPEKGRAPAKIGLDEYRNIGWALYPDGKLYCFLLTDGRPLGQPHEIKGTGTGDSARLTAWSFAADSETCAFGFQDGSVQTGRVGFKTSFLRPTAVPEAIRELKLGETAPLESGVVSRTPEGQFRQEMLEVALDPPVEAASNSPILQMSFAVRTEGPLVCTYSADGKTRLRSVAKQVNPVSDEVTFAVDTFPLPPADGPQRPPSRVLISGLGDNVILAWDDGHLCRFDVRNPAMPRQAETIEVAASPDARLTAIEYLLGAGTLMIGDSKGNVQAWTTSKPRNAPTPDGIVLAAAHGFSLGKSAVTALAVSSRDRMVAAGSADGKVRLLYVTSERIMGEMRAEGALPIESLAIAPHNDGVLAVNATDFSWWKVDPGYPEISLSTLFRPVWYEGYPGPTHSWQSSSGSDEFEPKFGLWPLIFGTLKATFYSMLFGAPLALLAAIYTSEFLHPRFRARIKPTVEVMASLPSVVLGFLAGLVIAPAAASVVPAILTSIFTVPVVLLLAAHLWQLLPIKQAVRWTRWRLLIITLVVPLGIIVGIVTGPIWERILFDGDLKAWLNGQIGTGTPGWFVMLLPLSALLTAWGMDKYVKPRLRRASAGWSRIRSGLAELARFIAATLAAFLVAWLAALFISQSPLLRMDPRGILVGTYIQRNALIVGFMMGFAIIPLIYTIADDALSSVPSHLRSASLGCGATQWQTTMRIVIPAAMSGLFSAVMIGLGRAVGETMIVLMAAGNTPIVDWNIFNGFQTLSATIATEMPEAPAGSTHYRTLFLAALALFAMTFIVNTIAEMIRLRFRRRAHEL